MSEWSKHGYVELVPGMIPLLELGRDITVAIARVDGRPLDSDVWIEATAWRFVLSYGGVSVLWGQMENDDVWKPAHAVRAVVYQSLKAAAIAIRDGQRLTPDLEQLVRQEVVRLDRFIRSAGDSHD